MDLRIVAVGCLVSYLIGSISFSRLVARLLKPDLNLDTVHIVNADGSQGAQLLTVGATTASIQLGPRVGCLIGWLDIFKGFIPTLVLKLLFPDQPYFLLGGLAAMTGHNWPVFYRFKGGTGMSTAYGALLVVDWLGVIVCSVVGMLFGFAILRDVVAAYLSGILLIIPWIWFRTHDPIQLIFAILLNVLFMLALVPELKRYLEMRKRGEINMEATMDATPMGRGMKKMAQRMGFMKDKK
jgi:acyl phosphate:glycerol-3-phosphate acyltransferase